ncbi:N-acetylmuramoyl-L-alanine amidase [Actinocatenispora rupis]|uniref:N-acetylmuramoyl-L-alanine amidase n=1 Tax=Actinocatenispora rupis TaxID=519421 RepID=A0A8J3J008_9ACTN|nr:N-acetylmuramoyl-L-alanine amidase [Actinocatenispora rupis]GID13256.1 N-acetylmuramoyl-L-alanine amidase [Actinocatenispora rupis]
MRPIRPGDRGPAVAEIRSVLARLGLLGDTTSDEYDSSTVHAVRAFQQSRGLTADGVVTDETWHVLDGARWQLGDRTLFAARPEQLTGDDVRQLQERLLEMGYDVGRADAVFGDRTAHALGQFQREVGLTSDGAFGPATMAALRRLGRKVTGGRPQLLRESAALHHAGPALVGKRIVIDPGHGGDDQGVVVPDGMLRWTEADLVYDLASRLEGRLAAAGVQVHLTRSRETWFSERDRARFANELGADLLVSLHADGHPNPAAQGVATYHFGGAHGVASTVGELLAGLVEREVAARTGMLDCGSHAKGWDLLRLTRMPAVRVEVGYLTSPEDRARLIDPVFRDRVVEAMVAAIQRMYLTKESDYPTGTFDVSSLRAAVAAAH